MSSKNLKNNPVLLIGLAILFVILISHFLNGVTIFGYTVKPVDLFMDIKPDSLLNYNSANIKIQDSKRITSEKALTKINETKNFEFQNSSLAGAVTWHLIEKAIKSSKTISGKNSSGFGYNSQQPDFKDVPITGNLDQMKYFFNALKSAKSQKIRVAHYGDSGVEGDAITANIREDLQKEFGGNGVGFLSITSQDITFRATTKQSFSDNWNTISVLTGNPQNIPLGINGFVAIPQAGSWVRYATTNWMPYLSSFGTVRLFYSNAKNSSIKYSFNNDAEQTANLKTGNNVQELYLSAPGGIAKSVKITATMSDQAYFYGVSLENGNGVYVDNFPWRGNTGLGFTKIPESYMNQFNKLLNYKLIILSFGANEAGFGSQDNTWYANQLIKVINNLKKAFPQTSILVIGVGDKSIKKGTRFVTDPTIPVLIKVQQQIVEKTGVAFWNLFDAMGGYNSMESWVAANPPLALMDYTHPSWQGAAKIGDMIAQAIIKAYNNNK